MLAQGFPSFPFHTDRRKRSAASQRPNGDGSVDVSCAATFVANTRMDLHFFVLIVRAIEARAWNASGRVQHCWSNSAQGGRPGLGRFLRDKGGLTPVAVYALVADTREEKKVNQ
jgi:hypothetical protein